jgi:small subunit ribosomal protein S11
MSNVANKTKKRKKNVTLGVVYIQATFNNTIVTVTDSQGNALAASSSGAHGFKGAKKATPYAAQVTVDKGSQRESALRAVFSQNLVVTAITDVSSVAHNGCKAPKRRRV